jgi:hypothetical protein
MISGDIGREKGLFGLFFSLYTISIVYLTATTPLLPGEVKILLSDSYTIGHLIASWVHRFTDEAFGIRAIFTLFGMVNLYLYYRLLSMRISDGRDRLFILTLYMILPGVLASSVLVNDAVVAITLTLLFILSYDGKATMSSYIALALLLFTDTAVMSLYLSLSIYLFFKKEYPLFIYSVTLFILSLFMGSFTISGRPEGHFLELMGLYAAIFSPLMFIYFFYSLYRVAFQGDRDMLWYISFTALAVSMLLSVRQKISITDFSPYLLIGFVIAVEVYFGSMRVRMKRFGRGYRIAGGVVISTMAISSAILVFHHPLYRVLGNPHSFFVSKIYEPYDYMHSLPDSGADRCYDRERISGRYRKVMEFYSIPQCGGESESGYR